MAPDERVNSEPAFACDLCENAITSPGLCVDCHIQQQANFEALAETIKQEVIKMFDQRQRHRHVELVLQIKDVYGEDIDAYPLDFDIIASYPNPDR